MVLLKENPISLREKAELFIQSNITINETFTEENALKLLHELEVYQIELELQNEELLAEKEKSDALGKKYSTLFDFAPSGYFNLNRSGNILEINLSGARMLRKEQEELKGSNFENHIHIRCKKNFEDFLEKLFEYGEKQQCELSMHYHDTHEVLFLLEGIVLDNDNCLLTAIDISEKHQAEKALQASETRLQELNATKDKFFSIIAHDLKGPFTSIIGFCEILSMHIKNNNLENIEKFTDIIHNSSLKAMDLLTNLLEWARLQSGRIKFNPQPVKINSIIDDVLSLLDSSIQRKSIALSRQVNEEIIIQADREMLSNVFRNLVSNAIKYTPQDGSINIKVAEQEDAFLITISDTGVGITPSNQVKLFRIDTHYSTRGTMNEEGTGLGLILCMEFIEKHGGKIWVESEPGKGSKFCFTILR